jgi:hypothetical protein
VSWTPPTLSVVAMLENSWKDWISDPGTVTDLSARVESFTMDRGRQNELDRFDPGTASLVLDNTDRKLDPDNPDGLVYRGDGKGLPLCPVQVSMAGGTPSVTDTTVFTGYLAPEGWPVVRDRGVGSTVTLQLVDLMWILAQAELPATLEEAVVTTLAPDYWTRGNALSSVQGGGGAYDDEIHPDQPWSLDAGSGIYVMADTTLMTTGAGDQGPSLYLQGGASVLQPEAIPDPIADFTAYCWYKVPAPLGVDVPYYVMRSLGAGVEVEWELQVYNGDLVFTLYTAGSPVASVAATDDTYDDSTARYVMVRKNGGTIDIFVPEHTDWNTSSTGVPSTVDAGTLTIGGNTTDGWVQSPAYWSRALSDYEVATLVGGLPPWGDDTFSDRMQRMMRLGGYEPTAGDIANIHTVMDDPTFWGADKVPANIGEALESATTDVDGAYWVTRAGDVLRGPFGGASSP